MSQGDFADVIIDALKNPTRASIFYQLVRKYEASATEISRELGIDVDVVYYHLKLLREKGVLSDPRVVVKGNYIEKYYSLRRDFKEKLIDSIKQLVMREEEMDVEDYRRIVIALLSVVQSIISSSIKKIKDADPDTLNNIKEEGYLETKIVFCNKETYEEILKKLREDIGKGVLETFDPVKKDYVMLMVAIPKIK